MTAIVVLMTTASIATGGVGAGVTPAAAAQRPAPGLADLRSWAAATASRIALDPAPRTVNARLAALRAVVRSSSADLRRLRGARRAAELRRMMRGLDVSLAGLSARMSERTRYAFFLAYQAQLERLAMRARLSATPTGRALRATAGQPAVADADLDGTSDVAELDADGDGLPAHADASDRGWGVPDAFLARPVATVPSTRYRTGYCIWATEQIPVTRTVAAAGRLRDRAADRGCAPPVMARASAARKTKAAKRKRYVMLRKAGIRAMRAELRGRALSLRMASKKPSASVVFEVMAGKKVVAKSKRVKLRRVARGRLGVIRATLNRIPSGRVLKLRITAKLGKRQARGTIALKVIRSTAVTPVPVGASSSVTPVTPVAPIAAFPPACAADADTDGDTIADCQELQGFQFTYYLPAAQCTGIGGAFTCLSVRQKHVTSDPNNPNTDGDGVERDGRTFQLTDRDEWGLALTGGLSDPSSRDSDGDGLEDVEERYRWGSELNSPDSDSDSGDPGTPGVAPKADLFDLAEVQGGVVPGSNVITSPTVADSDGDGFSDLIEVNDGTLNPAIVNAPDVALWATPNSSLTIDFESTSSELQGIELANDDRTTTGVESENVTEHVEELRDEIKVNADAGFEGKVPSGKIAVDYTHSWGTTDRTTARTKFTDESVKATGSKFARAINVDSPPKGSLSGTFTLKNTDTNSSVKVSELEVVGRIPCLPLPEGEEPCKPGSFSEVGPFKQTSDSIHLLQNETKDVKLDTGSASVARQQLRELAANPRNITFRVQNMTLHRAGESTSVRDQIGQSVPRSTAGITIDSGAGDIRTWAIAAAIGRAWGSPQARQALSIPIADALDLINIDHATTVVPSGENVLSQLDGKAAPIPPPGSGRKLPGAWFVLANDQTPEAVIEGVDDPDFRALKLGVKSQVTFAFLSDGDGDGLLSNEERLLRTSDAAADGADSDRDAATGPCTSPAVGCDAATNRFASDWFETRVGWKAGPVHDYLGNQIKPEFHVYSNPATCDGDLDGAPDGPAPEQTTCSAAATGGTLNATDGSKAEQTRRTDPADSNTDDDATDKQEPWLDAADTAPLTGNAPKGPVHGLWDLSQRAPLSTPNQSVEIPGLRICGQDPAPPGCAGATGYYRVTWKFAARGIQRRGEQAAEFAILADKPGGGGQETLLNAILPRHKLLRSYEFGTVTAKLYFRAPADLNNVVLRFTRLARAGGASACSTGDCLEPITLQSARLEPVAKSVFDDPVYHAGPNSPDPEFLAISLPGRELLPAPSDATSNQTAPISPTAGWGASGMATQATVARRFQPFGALTTTPRAQRVMARFSISGAPTAMDGVCGSECGLVSLGLLSGGGDPQIAGSTIGIASSNGTIGGGPSEGGMFVASPTSVPMAQAKVYGGDFPGTYYNLLASTTRVATGLQPSIAAAPQAGKGLHLNHVVLQVMDPRDYTGTVNTEPESGARKVPDGPWWGVGISPREYTKTGNDAANEGQDVILAPTNPFSGAFGNTSPDPRPNNSITMLGNGDGTMAYPELGIPTSPGTSHRNRVRWAVALQPSAASSQCPRDTLVARAMVSPVQPQRLPDPFTYSYRPYVTDLASKHLTPASQGRPALWLLKTTELQFTTMQLSIASGQCTVGPRIVQTMLMQRP